MVIMVNAGMSWAGLNMVGADGGQVGEQAGEAVPGVVVGGAFAGGLYPIKVTTTAGTTRGDG